MANALPVETQKFFFCKCSTSVASTVVKTAPANDFCKFLETENIFTWRWPVSSSVPECWQGEVEKLFFSAAICGILLSAQAMRASIDTEMHDSNNNIKYIFFTCCKNTFLIRE